MVITIEPGIYVPPTPEFPSAFHGLGVRIEDEVLVGKAKGMEVVLSVSAPKEVSRLKFFSLRVAFADSIILHT